MVLTHEHEHVLSSSTWPGIMSKPCTDVSIHGKDPWCGPRATGYLSVYVLSCSGVFVRGLLLKQ
jgi:hypothetical protein